MLVERVLEHTGGVPGGDSAPHVARFRAIYDADPVTGTGPSPACREALAALAAAGHGLGGLHPEAERAGADASSRRSG